MSNKKTYIYEVSRSLPEITTWYVESTVSLSDKELIEHVKNREDNEGDPSYGLHHISGDDFVFVGWGARGIFEHDAVAWRIDGIKEIKHKEDEDE